MPNATVLYMAGLYDIRGGVPCFCIITTAANDSMREVHDRMPLVLAKDQLDSWLNDSDAAPDILRMTPPKLDCLLLDAQIMLW